MTMKSGTTRGLVLVGRRCGCDIYMLDGPFGRPEEKRSVIGNTKQVITIRSMICPSKAYHTKLTERSCEWAAEEASQVPG